MQLLRIHYQKLFLCLTFVMLLLLLVRVYDTDTKAASPLARGTPRTGDKGRDNSINIDGPVLSRHAILSRGKVTKVNKYSDLFRDLAKEETCPLCFGGDLCEDISAGFLTLASDTPAVEEGWVAYEAHLGDLHKLAMKVPSSEHFKRLDELVCSNVSLSEGCPIHTAALKSFLGRPQELTPRFLSRLLHSLGITRKQYPLLMCPSKKLLTVIERTFDDNDDHSLSQTERLNMVTSLAVAPEIVVLKLLTKSNMNVGFPRMVGVCGRVVVLEGELTPLTSMLDEPFNVRASLAAQILTMVDDFMEDHPEWYLFYALWSPEGLAVNKEGEVVLTDLANIAVIDKAVFRDEYEEAREPSGQEEVCNKECFQRFTSEMYREGHDTEQLCGRVEDVGHLMYAAACAMVLSDMTQHKYLDYFSTQHTQQPRTTRGLLHDIPAADRSTVEELLSECVDEITPGGRLQAAQELRDFLADFLLDEEDDQDEDEEDEENYEEDYDYEDEYSNKAAGV